MDPQEVLQLFNCIAHPTDLTPENLWNKPVMTHTRTELSRPGEPGITKMIVEKGIQQKHEDDLVLL